MLACVIYAAFVSTPTVSGGEATTMVWSYLTEIIFNMLVLVGLIKGSDRIIHEMMGLERYADARKNLDLLVGMGISRVSLRSYYDRLH